MGQVVEVEVEGLIQIQEEDTTRTHQVEMTVKTTQVEAAVAILVAATQGTTLEDKAIQEEEATTQPQAAATPITTQEAIPATTNQMDLLIHLQTHPPTIQIGMRQTIRTGMPQTIRTGTLPAMIETLRVTTTETLHMTGTTLTTETVQTIQTEEVQTTTTTTETHPIIRIGMLAILVEGGLQAMLIEGEEQEEETAAMRIEEESATMQIEEGHRIIRTEINRTMWRDPRLGLLIDLPAMGTELHSHTLEDMLLIL